MKNPTTVTGQPLAGMSHSTRPNHGQHTEREPGTGDIVTRDENGRVIQRIPAGQAQGPAPGKSK
jgi:hypothetical protein